MNVVTTLASAGLATAALAALFGPLRSRILLARATHPSLQGHARLARWIAKQLPFYEFDERHFFDSDAAPPQVKAMRQTGFDRLAGVLNARAPQTNRLTESLAP